MKARKAGSGGFTLIEVLVAIAVFALLMSIVYGGFSTAVRAYDAAEKRIDDVERMRVVSAFIRRSVGGAQALAIAVRREWVLQFEGDAQRLRYIADLPGYVGDGGLHELVIEIEKTGDRHDLVLRRRPVALDRFGELSGPFDTRVLGADISGFDLRYFGREEEREEPAWRDDWTSSQRMPALVEINITPANAPPWPLLQVRPWVDSVRYLNAPNLSAADQPDELPNPNSSPNQDPNANPNTSPGASPGGDSGATQSAPDAPVGQRAVQ